LGLKQQNRDLEEEKQEYYQGIIQQVEAVEELRRRINDAVVEKDRKVSEKIELEGEKQ